MQWCESSFVTGGKTEVSAQTKEYIVDSLESLTRDIESMCDELSKFLQLQNRAIDSATLDLEVVKERLWMCKLKSSEQRITNFRASARLLRRLDKIQSLTDRDREIHMQAIATYKQSLDNRFSSFSDVGSAVCQE